MDLRVGADTNRYGAAGIKHDWFRLMARRDPVGIRLITRRGKDWTTRYPPVNHLIDGEVVCCNERGVAAFQMTVTVQNIGSEREVCESSIAERKTLRDSSRGSLGALSVAGVLTQACGC